MVILLPCFVQPMTISASGQGVELPVFVERETVEMRICLLNRLYQDSLVIHNRWATVTLGLRQTLRLGSLACLNPSNYCSIYCLESSP